MLKSPNGISAEAGGALFSGLGDRRDLCDNFHDDGARIGVMKLIYIHKKRDELLPVRRGVYDSSAYVKLAFFMLCYLGEETVYNTVCMCAVLT